MVYENLWPMKIHGLEKSMAYENSWPMKIYGPCVAYENPSKNRSGIPAWNCLEFRVYSG